MSVLGAVIDAIRKPNGSNVPQGPLKGRTYRSGQVPNKPTYPYARIHWPVDDADALRGDGATIARESEGQVDIFELLADEDPTLWEAVRDLLHDVRLPSDSHILRCRVTSSVRFVENDDGIVRNMLLVRLHRLA